MSLTDIERGLIARYLARVLSGDLPLRSARYLMYWLSERAEGLVITLPAPLAEQVGQYYGTNFKAAEFERVYLVSRAELLRTLDLAARETPRPEPVATNIERLVKALAVPQPEAALKIMGLIACCQRYEQVMYLSNAIFECAGPLTRAIGRMVGEPARVVEDLLSPANELVGSGLIQIREGDYPTGPSGRYAIPYRINSCLDQTFADFAEMRNALIGDPLTTPMSPDDYEHVAEDRDLITAVLAGAAREHAAGLNILLYGPPGSGKTELAKLAAASAGLSLFATGEDSPHDGEVSRVGRLSDLVFSQRLLSDQPKTALLFDEMEDVAVHLIRRGGSKVFMNRLLETNPAPIIWTSNNIGDVDPAILRRMTLAVELKRPPAPQRRRILGQLVKRHGLDLSADEIDQLSRKVDATPAILENAIRAAKLAGGGAAAAERAALGIVRAVSGIVARRHGAVPDFDPLLSRASHDLVVLADQLVGGKARAFSLCLSGPPGTGKSAFARYLAGRLGLELMQKRASDLFGPYLGQTEKQIAAAFEEAREANAFLVFDEADSLLMDRRDAVRSWEISQVNEMLTWMEEHPLPIAFTTNLMDRIDTASLRRFTFDVRFAYLDRAGLERAWLIFFGPGRIPPLVLAYANLTPGDFAKVRKQAEMLAILDDPARIAESLGEVSRGKPDAKGAFGFTG